MAADQTRYRIRATDQTAAFLRRLHPQIKRKVRDALRLIIADPGIGKSLMDELAGLRSLRVGRFRIIYRIAPSNIIEIITIGPRNSIYKETYKIIKKATT